MKIENATVIFKWNYTGEPKAKVFSSVDLNNFVLPNVNDIITLSEFTYNDYESTKSKYKSGDKYRVVYREIDYTYHKNSNFVSQSVTVYLEKIN